MSPAEGLHFSALVLMHVKKKKESRETLIYALLTRVLKCKPLASDMIIKKPEG